MKTKRERAIFALVTTCVLFWGLTAGIGYPVTGNPQWLYMVPVVLAGCAVMLTVMWLVLNWVDNGTPENGDNQ